VTRKAGHRIRGKKTTEGSQKSPVGAPITNSTGELALENADLMAEDEDLEVLVGVILSQRDDQLEDSTQAEVDKGEEHDSRSWHPDPNRGQPAEARNWLAIQSIGVLVPFTRPHVRRQRGRGAEPQGLRAQHVTLRPDVSPLGYLPNASRVPSVWMQ
jgi:hypothetical protein